MSRPTAAALLGRLQAVTWTFLTRAARLAPNAGAIECACRTAIGAGEAFVMANPAGCEQAFCVQCATRARVEWARQVADLEWRAEREAAQEAEVRATAKRLGATKAETQRLVEEMLGYESSPEDVNGFFRPLTLPVEVHVAIPPGHAVHFESTITLEEPSDWPTTAQAQLDGRHFWTRPDIGGVWVVESHRYDPREQCLRAVMRHESGASQEVPLGNGRLLDGAGWSTTGGRW